MTNVEIQKHKSFSNIKQNTSDSYHIQNEIDNTYNSTLFGVGKIESLSKEHVNEINRVLYLESIFKTALDILPDIKWVYYSSNNRYIYLAPSILNVNKQFIENQFKKNFWTEAAPPNNKTKELVLTKLYEDGVSKELLTTLSLPIFNKSNKFLGIVSIDIGLQVFNKIFNKYKNISGDTYLINHNNYILASTTNFDKNTKLSFSNTKQKSKNIFNDKIKLVYLENERKKHSIIINRSMSKIFLFLFLLSIIYLSYHLACLLRKVERLANYDSLTKLLNRRALRDEASKYIELSKRNKNPISFILIDIDDFKSINDTYGHAIGDLVLTSLSDTLLSSVRKSDLVSRYGGEEFLVVLANTNLEKSFIQAERLREKVLKLKLKNIKGNITISLGCSELKENESLDNAIQRADELLYEAKKNGKNQTKY